MGKDVSPQGNYWIYCHTHGRFERVELLTVAIVNLGQDVHGGSFPLRREEDVGFVRVTDFKTEIEVVRCWTCSRSTSGSQVVFDPRTVREARDGQRGVKAQVQPSPGSAQGTLGGTSE